MWAGAGHRPSQLDAQAAGPHRAAGAPEKDSTSLFLDVDLLLRFDFVPVQTAEGVTGFLRLGSVVAETFAKSRQPHFASPWPQLRPRYLASIGATVTVAVRSLVYL